jgi:hypothetical protein
MPGIKSNRTTVAEALTRLPLGWMANADEGAGGPPPAPVGENSR